MVEYYIWGDFRLIQVLFLLISIIILIIKACVSSTPVKASKNCLLYFYFLMKGNYKVH
jgi:hypothetical protein